MPDQELVNYIKKSLSLRVTRDDITKKLLNVGWKKWDIDSTFSFIELENKSNEEEAKEYLSKPVIEKIKSVDSLVYEMLRVGKSRDEIFQELSNVFTHEQIEAVFNKKSFIEAKRMNPSVSLAFIIVALSFVFLISIIWGKLGGSSGAYAILLFCLFYFISGLYIKYREKAFFGGEVMCFFSAIGLGFAIFLSYNNLLSNLSYIEDFILWIFTVLLMGILADSILILKFANMLGVISVSIYLFMAIKDGKLFSIQGIISSSSVLLFFFCLLLGFILVNKKINN
jgi:uncharacterized protein Smg (DUF494 family)